MLRQTVKVEVCVREAIRFESGISDKEGTTSDGASDEAGEQENSKLGWANDPAT